MTATPPQLLAGLTVRVEDVAERARAMFGDDMYREIATAAGGQPAAHDYRLVFTTPTGREVTMHRGATADDIARYLEADRA